MYEMYPDAWPVAIDHRQHYRPGEKPRRRARKEHSVIPNRPCRARSPKPAPYELTAALVVRALFPNMSSGGR